MTSEKASTRRAIDSVQIMDMVKRFEDAVKAKYWIGSEATWPAIEREYEQARQNLVDALQR